jgi:uncharacterized protein YkwD
MALELGQRRLVAGLVATILLLGLVTGASALVGGGGDGNHQALRTADGSSTTSTTALVDGASRSTVGATDASSDGTGQSSTTSTAVKGKGGKAKAPAGGSSTTATTAKGKGKGSATTTGPTTTAAPTTTAPAGPCATGGGGQDDQIASLYCAYRRDQGLAPMSRNRALDGVAQTWAAKMASDADAALAAGEDRSVALAHNLADNPDATYPGGYPAAVKADCSSKCTGWAENVAYNTTASGAWQGWLHSSSHLADIRGGPHGGEFGIGAAQDSGGYWWFTQDFGFHP